MWSLDTYELVGKVTGHWGAILCLFLSEDREMLFSSAGDAIINVIKTRQTKSVDHS